MIRRFTLSDLESVLEIEMKSFPKAPYDSLTFLNLHWQYPNTFFVYVAKHQGYKKGKVVGYIVFSDDGHIISLAVHPEWRRRKIGKALIERLENHPGIRKLWAEVRVGNLGARAFYRYLGFKVKARVPNYYGDEDALIVEKQANKC